MCPRVKPLGAPGGASSDHGIGKTRILDGDADGGGGSKREPAYRVEAGAGEQRQPRRRWHDGRRVAGLPEETLATDTGRIVERRLHPPIGEAGQPAEAGRRVQGVRAARRA